MQPSAVEVGPKSSRLGRVVPVGKLRLVSLDRLDGRTLAARRANQLARDFMAELGGAPSPAQKAACENAAVLTVLAEDAAARRLGGAVDISLEDTVRLARVAQTAVNRLGLRRREAPGGDVATMLGGRR